MCLLGAKAKGGGVHPKQSLVLKVKLFSLGGLGPPCRVSLWVPCCCTLDGGLVPLAEQQPKALVSCLMLWELN